MPKRPPRILVVEDDTRIRREILASLQAEGFEVGVGLGVADARLAARSDFDLVLLDLGLPDGDGLELCKELRAQGRTVPIVILTARDAPDDRVRGLEVGADDYVVKPFYPPELLARVRSVLRRSGRAPGIGPLRCGELWADPEARRAGCGDRLLELKPREFDLLVFFLRAPGRVWTRSQLLEAVWGPSFSGDARTVDGHVSRLRAAIEEDPGDPRYLETVWGIGYRLREA